MTEYEYKQEAKRRLVMDKKEKPVRWKVAFLERMFVPFCKKANDTLNSCGWQYAKDSHEHNMFKLYRYDMEDFYHRVSYEINKKIPKDVLNDVNNPITRDFMRRYLNEAKKLLRDMVGCVGCSRWKHSLPYTQGQVDFYNNWIDKNLKKFEDNEKQTRDC